MERPLIIPGHYSDHTFVPDGVLPDVQGPAELIIRAPVAIAPTSIFDLIGTAEQLRTAEDIAAQVQRERDAWGTS